MRRFVVGAALLLALAGCGGDPKPDPAPSTSTAPVATPTPTAPAMPEAAKANTKAGAIAFVKYYVGMINEAQRSGETGVLRAFDSPDCRSCARARKTVDDIYTANGHIEGGDLNADVQMAARRPDVGGWTVFANVTFGEQKVIRGDSVQVLPGGRSVLTFIVKRVGASWTTLQWSRGS